jgi:hypothetical protein
MFINIEVKSMKHHLSVFLGFLLILSARVSLSPISTNGVVDISPYAGLQPDLVEGASARDYFGTVTLAMCNEPLILQGSRLQFRVIAQSVSGSLTTARRT